MADNGAKHWLVVGHGSVGAFLAGRLSRNGAEVSVLDPSPRLPIVAGTASSEVPSDRRFEYIVSCVPPDAARDVRSASGGCPGRARPALRLEYGLPRGQT